MQEGHNYPAEPQRDEGGNPSRSQGSAARVDRHRHTRRRRSARTFAHWRGAANGRAAGADRRKAALYDAWRHAGIPWRQFARDLGVAESEVRRLLNLDHCTKAATIDQALRHLGEPLYRDRQRGNQPGSRTRVPGNPGEMVGAAVFGRLLKDLGIDCSPHGFRSLFRSWCSDEGIDRKLTEQVLAHAVGSQVEEGPWGELEGGRRDFGKKMPPRSRPPRCRS